MRITPDGKTLYDDIFELNYYLLTELELEVTNNGNIFDPKRNEILAFNGMIVKGSVNPNNINYAGQGEIEFNVLENVRLITTLFGRFIEQKQQEEGMPFLSWFSDEIIDDTELKFSNLTVKHDTYTSTVSDFYHNKCLKFIDMIFRLDGEIVELHNFDSTISEED